MAVVRVDKVGSEASDQKEEIKYDNLHFNAIFLNRTKGLLSEGLFLTPTIFKKNERKTIQDLY